MASVNKAKGKPSAKPNNLFCCRACLATNGKLVNMRENKLAGEFFRVSGITIREKEKLPQHLCVSCAALMRRCAAFRAKCLRANQCLFNLKGELTTDGIRNVDRFAHQLVDLTQSEIQVDCIGVDIPANLDEDTKLSGKKELYIEIDSLHRNEIKINVVKEYDMIETDKYETMGEVEYLEDDTDEDVDIKDVLEIEDTIINEPIEYNTTNDTHNSSMRKRKADEFLKSYVKMEKQIKTEKDGESRSNRRGKRGTPYKLRSAENNFMPTVNLEEFKETYNVDIVVLSQEEQMAELESRRASKEYKSAPLPCEPCAKHFRDQDAYNHHIAKHDEKMGPFECPTCKMRFKQRSKRMTHYDKHRIQYVCRQCGFVSRARSQAKIHHAWHDGKMYKCPHCEMQFSKHSTYLGHVRRVHKVLNVVCDMCGETFVNDNGVRMHKAYVHGTAHWKKPMDCKTCEVTFISLDALKNHKMAAGEHDKMAACAQCGGCFHSEDTLKEHVEAEHPSCQECNATFLNTESYNTHIERKHLGKGDATRDRRNAANRRARALGLPLPYPAPKHHKQYVKQVCCDHCGKMFQSMTVLRYHMKKLRGETLPHACHQCPKSFAIRQQLENHMRVHTGEKPFLCELCDHTFTLKSNLARHIEIVHMGKKSECTVCGRLLASPFAVRMHIRTVHNGEPWPKRAPRKSKPKLSAMSPQSSSS